MSFLRKTSLLLPLRFPPTTKYPFSSSAAALTKKRPSASAIKPEQPTATLDGNVDASIATVMVHMQQNTAPQEEKNVLSSLKENVIAGEILKTSSSAFRRDKIHDIARGVADKFVNMEEEFQARRRNTNPSIVSKEFKPLPFQTMHPSAPQAADTAIPTPSSDFRPLPFQTSASRAALKSHTARAPVQSDWLADSDDVSGVSTTAPSFAASIDDISNSRVTGDVPHLDLAEAMEDTSVDELGRGAQKNRDYTASTPTFSSHVNHRNKSIDHDNGYGVSLAAQHEEQTATEIPPVNSTAPILLEPAASQASGGTMEDLACVNEPLVINENHQPSLGGYATGEHQIALGQAALRARFTQGDGPEVSINPGADSAIQSSRKYRPRV